MNISEHIYKIFKWRNICSNYEEIRPNDNLNYSIIEIIVSLIWFGHFLNIYAFDLIFNEMVKQSTHWMGSLSGTTTETGGRHKN